MGKLKQNLELAKAAIIPIDRLRGSSGEAPNKRDEVAAIVPMPFDVVDILTTGGMGTAIKTPLKVWGVQGDLEKKMGAIRQAFFRESRPSI
jgi:hypothetical protein